MYRLALRMLFGDRGKYLMLVSGLTFASLLMAQQASVFVGVMSWTFGTVRNMRANIWVADPKVEQANDNKPLRDTDVHRVRSVDGVAWAVPLYSAVQQARMLDGSFKMIQLVGIDSTSLAGAPQEMLKGKVEDLRLPNTVIIDDYGIERLSEGRGRPLDVGDVFEINDREARIVGICKAARSFTGGPYVWTTYDRAVLYAPPQRKMMTFVLGDAAPGHDPAEVARRIERETGLKAYTEREFMWSTVWWYVRNTGIPIAFGTTVLLGFIVGVVISGQTFYAFVLENLRHLGAFKAMGAGNGLLCRMLVLQALAVGFVGYGVGMGLVTVFGLAVLKKGMPPFLLVPHIMLGVFAVVMLISAVSAILGILKVAKVDSAMVFRL